MPVIKSVFGSRGVASDSYLASKAALEVLEEGGNAFDAAIAASAVLSVVLPHTGGPGGDGFMMAFYGDDIITYMSSGKSPSGFKADEYLKLAPKRGPLTVTVPGLVYLWGFLSEELCSMPLEKLLRPAESLAYNGFYAGYYLSRASKQVESELSNYRWAKFFKGIEPGMYIANKEMARTLRTIATRGWDEFYYGRLAEKFVTELQEQGVDIGLDDLMDHEGLEVRPLKLDLEDMVAYELPPNTQGVTTLQMLSAIYELGLNQIPFDEPSRIERWSEIVEVVYRFRDTFLGDPEYVKINVPEFVSYSKAKQLLDRQTAQNMSSGDGDTTFFAVYDGESLVGFIQSLFHPFGSGLVALGFPVQNRGYGFAKKAGLPNSPAPRKRPLHTLSVLVVDSEDDRYVIGCAGGDWRPQIHTRIFENIFIYGMSLPEALNAPRFIFTETSGSTKRVVVESRLRAPQAAGLAVEMAENYGPTGLVHVVAVKKSKQLAQFASDPRSEGLPLAT